MRFWRLSLVLVMLAGLSATVTTTRVGAADVPNGFTVATIADGFDYPTSFVIAADGSIFVTEKRGKVFKLDSVNDPTPTEVADMRLRVHNNSDRGMTALAVDPNFPAEPYVYVGYTVDKAPFGGTIPTYGHAGGNYDPCPNSGTIGCPALSRISRLNLANGASEQVLFEGHCQQFPFHSVGDLAFDDGGYLLASFGDGSTGSFNEYGQRGNACGDPGGPIGSNLSAPTTEGGHARSQDILTRTDPTGVNGSILRVNPDNFDPVSLNPLFADQEVNAQRMIATGFRNPFRLTVDADTGRIFVGNVGGAGFDEIQLVENDFVNGGWPCYEGDDIMSNHFWTRTTICQQLAAAGDHDRPLFSYTRNDTITAGENCPTGGLSVSGLALNRSGFGPQNMHGALFFTDYTRACIWYLPRGANGIPDPANPQLFASDVGNLVDLSFGPDGALYGMDIVAGELIRISADGQNQNHPPVALFTPSVTSGAAPLDVRFDARASSDPDQGDVLRFRWYYDDDDVTDDWGKQVSATFTDPGQYDVRLEITDQGGLVGSITHTIVVGAVPTVSMNQPAVGRTFEVGGTIPLAADGVDGAGDVLPDSAYEWELVLHHCVPGASCHTHGLDAVHGADGSISMPDHEYPSYVEFNLTVTDDAGLESITSRQIDYQTVDLAVQTQPTGLQVLVGSTAQTTPFIREVARNATTSVSTNPSPTVGGVDYALDAWLLGGVDEGTDPGIEVIVRANSTLVANFDVAGGTDVTRPSAPQRLYAAPEQGAIRTRWLSSTDDIGVTQYLIYRSTNGSFGSLIATIDDTTSWVDTGVTPGVTYTYGVKARDAAGNTSWRSNLSSSAADGVVDTERPSAPQSLFTRTRLGELELEWSPASDNVGVTSYLIYRSTDGSFGSLIATVGDVRTWVDTTADVATTYTYGVKARDAAGNTSWRSNLIDGALSGGVDVERPSTPRRLQTTDSGTDVVLNWVRSTDNVAVTRYEIYRSTNGSFGTLLVTVGNVDTWTDTSTVLGTTYTYAVKALDASDNRSWRSNLSHEAV